VEKKKGLVICDHEPSLFRFFVGAEGLEDRAKSDETPSDAVNGDEEAPTPDDVRDASDPDAALKQAIKAATDAGLYDRARALLDVLARTGAAASVVDLRERTRR
jgi:hypothetical protein